MRLALQPVLPRNWRRTVQRHECLTRCLLLICNEYEGLVMNHSMWIRTERGLNVLDLPMRVPDQSGNAVCQDERQASLEAVRQIRRNEQMKRVQWLAGGIAVVVLYLAIWWF